MSTTPDSDPEGPPFPKHRTYYIVLKWLVIAAAVVLALTSAFLL